MSIITLTTDLGYRDNYVALIKAFILKNSPETKIVDISHDIDKYNLQQAAYIFGNSFHEFPKDTIHVLGIKSVNTKNPKNLIIRYKNQYIICPDNGLFSLFYDGSEVVYYAAHVHKFPEGILYPRNPLSEIAIELANGKFVSDIAEETFDVLQSLNFQPVCGPNNIIGRCIYIDSYGNVITNITRSFFEESKKNRQFTIHLPNVKIDKISSNYDDAGHADALAIFNTSGYLEIAINKGAAKQLLFPRNLMTHTDFHITIEFDE